MTVHASILTSEIRFFWSVTYGEDFEVLDE